MRTTLAALWLLGLALGGCEEGAPPGPMHAPSTCPGSDEAPLPDGSGGRTCVRVGAGETATGRDFPDVAGLPEPVVFVAPDGSDDGGDGSRALPYATIARALADSPGTVALSRGAHPATATIEPPAEVVIAGAGAGDTTIEGGLRASSPLTLRALAVHGGVESVAATLILDDVAIEGADRGIDASGGTLDARRVTVRRSAEISVRVADGADATIRELLASDGARYGVVVVDSHLDLADSLITRHGRDGLALLGGVDLDTDGTPDTHVIARTASTFNGVTAMRVEGPMARADATLLTLSGTMIPAGTAGGDGLYVGDGATVALDAAIASDAARGHGSELVGNARSGALVADLGTSVDLRGALFGSNQGPGVFLQTGAVAASVGYSRVEDNRALGIGVASGARAIGIPCNTIQATREGVLSTVASGDLTLGDGLSLSEGGADGTDVVGNLVTDNARFGIVISGSSARLRDNRGDGNRYAIGTFGTGARDIDASNTVRGREDAPAAAPTARGEIARTGVTGP